MQGHVLVAGQPRFTAATSVDEKGRPVVIGGWVGGHPEIIYRINPEFRVMDSQGHQKPSSYVMEYAVRQALLDIAQFMQYESAAERTPEYLIDTVLDNPEHDFWD